MDLARAWMGNAFRASGLALLVPGLVIAVLVVALLVGGFGPLASFSQILSGPQLSAAAPAAGRGGPAAAQNTTKVLAEALNSSGGPALSPALSASLSARGRFVPVPAASGRRSVSHTSPPGSGHRRTGSGSGAIPTTSPVSKPVSTGPAAPAGGQSGTSGTSGSSGTVPTSTTPSPLQTVVHGVATTVQKVVAPVSTVVSKVPVVGTGLSNTLNGVSTTASGLLSTLGGGSIPAQTSTTPAATTPAATTPAATSTVGTLPSSLVQGLLGH